MRWPSQVKHFISFGINIYLVTFFILLSFLGSPLVVCFMKSGGVAFDNCREVVLSNCVCAPAAEVAPKMADNPISQKPCGPCDDITIFPTKLAYITASTERGNKNACSSISAGELYLINLGHATNCYKRMANSLGRRATSDIASSTLLSLATTQLLI